MPEVPEMEIYKNNLNQWVKHKGIAEVYILRPKCLNKDSQSFTVMVQGQVIEEIGRKGKFLIFSLDNGDFLLTHMMLDGRLYFLPKELAEDVALDLKEADALRKKIQGLPGKPSVIFKLSDGSLLFFCTLTFGYLHYLNTTEVEDVLSKLGVDPLDSRFTTDTFFRLLKGKRGAIKPWLMEQKNLSGIGNAYSNESLFQAGILPDRPIPRLSEEEKGELFLAIVNILEESIRLGGDMEEPFAPWDNFTGGYISHFKVYDREGKECKQCGNIIKRKEVGGRNAFFCPHCQT